MTPALPLLVRERSPAHRGLQAAGFVVLAGLAIFASTSNPFQLGQLTVALLYATAIAGLNLATGYTGQLPSGTRRSSGSAPTPPASWSPRTTGTRWSR
jgi:hypothetical protein